MSKGELVAAAAQPAVPAYYSAPQVPVFSFQDIHRMASSFAKSGLYGIKDENQALALMLEAQAQGKHPASIMRDYDMIQGRLSKKSGAMLRDFQASGGKVEWQELSDTRAAALFSHPLSPKPLLIDRDMNREKLAGLTDKNGGMYSKFGRAMLRSRCISEGIRSTAPDATEMMYTSEEIAGMNDVPPPVSINNAVAAAVTAPPVNEVEAYINAMDVADLKTLEDRFTAAWKSTKDPEIRARYKAAYEGMKIELAMPPSPEPAQ